MFAKPRHLGLSRAQRVAPLLSNFKPLPVQAAAREPENFDDSPISSASELSGSESVRSEDSDSLASRADIKRTDFGKKSTSKPSQRSTNTTVGRSPTRRRSDQSSRTRSKRHFDSDDEVEPVAPRIASKKRKRQEASRGIQSRDSHDDWFKAKTDSFQRGLSFDSTTIHSSQKAVYGKAAKQPSSQRSMTKSSSDRASTLASSSTKPKKPKKQGYEPSSRREAKGTPVAETALREVSPLPRKPRKSANAKESDPNQSQKPESSDEETPRKVFKMPSIGTVDLTLSSPVAARNNRDILHDTHAEEEDLSSLAQPAEVVCPMCNEPVDRQLLDSFSNRTGGHKRMTIHQQQRFCHHHRVRSARATWIDRGYPDIDWAGLEARIASYVAALRAILESGSGSSHYAAEYRQRVDSGQQKTLLKTRASALTPGYYGMRGLRVMTESVVQRLSQPLKRRAIKDRLVSARGHTAYVQGVLVPELAVRLIMQDMGIKEEAAREVLKESVAVGELLNEDAGDEVGGEDDGSGSEALSEAEEVDVVDGDAVSKGKVRLDTHEQDSPPPILSGSSLSSSTSSASEDDDLPDFYQKTVGESR